MLLLQPHRAQRLWCPQSAELTLNKRQISPRARPIPRVALVSVSGKDAPREHRARRGFVSRTAEAGGALLPVVLGARATRISVPRMAAANDASSPTAPSPPWARVTVALLTVEAAVARKKAARTAHRRPPAAACAMEGAANAPSRAALKSPVGALPIALRMGAALAAPSISARARQSAAARSVVATSCCWRRRRCAAPCGLFTPSASRATTRPCTRMDSNHPRDTHRATNNRQLFKRVANNQRQSRIQYRRPKLKQPRNIIRPLQSRKWRYKTQLLRRRPQRRLESHMAMLLTFISLKIQVPLLSLSLFDFLILY